MSEFCSYMWSVDDWQADELFELLDNREAGIYRHLLDEAWKRGSLSSSPEVLARLAREPLDYFLTVWAKISYKFRVVPHSNGARITSKRLELDRDRVIRIREKRAKNGRKGAEKRWENAARKSKPVNKKHGNTIASATELLWQNDSQTQTQTQKEGEEDSSLIHSPNLEISSPIHQSQRAKNVPVAGSAQTLFDCYNQNRGTLPIAKELTKERRAKCLARLRNNNGSFVKDWNEAVVKAAATPFCRGEGEGGWRVSFDWLILNDTNYLKVLEGKYDTSGGNGNGQQRESATQAKDRRRAESSARVAKLFGGDGSGVPS